MTLSDINESGKATLSFIANNVQGSVLIDLTTGKLLKVPGAKPPSSPVEEPVLVENRLESPSGRYVLECSDNASKPILIKTSSGKTLRTISRKQFPDISEMDFSPRERYISFMNSTPSSKKWSSPLYIYSIAEKKLIPIGDGDIGDFGWSKDDRFFWYVNLPSNQPSTLGGSLRVTDATAGFKTVLNYGRNVTSLLFSPDNRHIAVLELVKDEYGDISNKKLTVLSISSGKAKTLAVGRRKPAFAWASNTSLAVTTYDKYAVPTLSLITVDGRVTKLVSDRSVAKLDPLGLVAKSDFVVYKSDSSAIAGNGEQVLWKVKPGSQPIRLFPKGVRK